MDGKPHLCGLIHTYSQTVKQNNTYIVYNRNYRKYRVFYERSICSYIASHVSCTPSFLKILISTSESITEV